MVIRIEDHPLALNMLLFIRHAWSIAADADIPELRPSPDPGSSTLPDSASVTQWEDRWRIAWRRAWDWYEVRDPSPSELPTPEMIRDVSRPGQDLHPLIPPLWSAEYGWEGLDLAAFNSWDQHLGARIPTDAERWSLLDLIPAWESGLDTVIVLPYAGYFARRISRRHLAVSAATRDEPESYGRALRVRM